MVRRHYVDNAPTATMGTAIDGLGTTVALNSIAGFPTTFPFTATIDLGQASAEVVLVTASAGNNFTVTRNYDGQGAFSHLAGATFDHTAVAADFDEANQHVNAVTGVHGTTGTLVDTSSPQTLSNKTLTAASYLATGGAPGTTITQADTVSAAIKVVSSSAVTVFTVTGAGVTTVAGLSVSAGGSLTMGAGATASLKAVTTDTLTASDRVFAKNIPQLVLEYIAADSSNNPVFILTKASGTYTLGVPVGPGPTFQWDATRYYELEWFPIRYSSTNSFCTLSVVESTGASMGLTSLNLGSQSNLSVPSSTAVGKFPFAMNTTTSGVHKLSLQLVVPSGAGSPSVTSGSLLGFRLWDRGLITDASPAMQAWLNSFLA